MSTNTGGSMQAMSHPFPKPLDVAKYDPFLAPGPVIDSDHPTVRDRAELLGYGLNDDKSITKACFEWVRDEIQHSADFERGPVTCKASDVLLHGTGFCYAKCHLLTALLRANGVPAGLCYQRLRTERAGRPYIVHGLAAVHLPRIGWYRMDPRGNKVGIEARYTPPREQLAWPAQGEGEVNFPAIWATPMPEVVEVLEKSLTWQEVLVNLPDRDPSEH